MLTKLYVKGAVFLDALKSDQRGVTAIEYAIVAVGVATVAGAAFASGGSFDEALTDAFDEVTAKIAAIVKT